MTTQSVDPRGQHQLPVETSLPGGKKNTRYWNDRFPRFDVAFEVNCDEGGDPKAFPRHVEWLITAGSDLQLQCEQVHRGAAHTSDYVVRSYDSSGNALNVLGQFRRPADALAALPTLMTVAHMLYPNFLLMAKGAQHHMEA